MRVDIQFLFQRQIQYQPDLRVLNLTVKKIKKGIPTQTRVPSKNNIYSNKK